MTTVFLGLAGGLGLFIYGMKLMSDGIEKAAGAKLREILEVFTRSKFTGLLVGIVFTGIIQSSSATTVMVVSFVNAGLMDLYQAIGIIFGANIGTTVTSQLVSFNLSEIAPLFLLAGVIMIQFINNPTVKKAGEVILGFGVLFTGLTMMKDSMSRFTLRVPQKLLDQLGYIAEYEGRTKNRELEHMIRLRVADFEKKQGVPPCNGAETCAIMAPCKKRGEIQI